ncbi:hypothetical protein AGMMS49983_20930 [Clostridia bacterium]|nr:hypothetical protein AGMMS49983_20930 [Clostridia bacterium]
MGGLLHKNFKFDLSDGGAEGWIEHKIGARVKTPEAIPLGEVGSLPYELLVDMPGTMNYTYTVNISQVDDAGNEISAAAYGDTPLADSDAAVPPLTAPNGGVYPITEAGNYEIMITGEYADAGSGSESGNGADDPKTSDKAKTVTTATVTYRASFSVTIPPPIFKAGRGELQQGDIYTLSLRNVPEGVVPTLETELGPATFAKVLPGAVDPSFETVPGLANWLAEIPVSNHRAPGTYAVKATAGDQTYEESVTVSLYDYDFQNLIIDTSVPSVAEAITGTAVAEFREKVGGLMPLISEEIYWQGYFEMPVDLGDRWFISTQFGEIRITNGDQGTKRSHYGMDFAVPEGTPVHAGNAGKVLLAEDLLNTGNTVVIDHGGGLKSYYYHMSALHTTTGAMVEKGELIGEVGSEGYSTGPHLHYEMRIGEQAISPSMLFDPGAGLYSAE